MKYILYLLLIAVIFGLVALVDFLLGKLFPKSELQKKGKAVRLPRYSFILGLLLFLIGLIAVQDPPGAVAGLPGDFRRGCVFALEFCEICHFLR